MQVTEMELRQLRHLILIADTGSFNKAAQILKITQSTISRSMLSLEMSLGIKLLDRSGKSIELTPHGRVVYERAKRALQEAGAITDDSHRLREQKIGSLRVGLGPWVGAIFAADLLKYMISAHPGVEFKIVRSDGTSQLKDLQVGKLDALIIDPRNIGSATDLKMEMITDLRSIFLCRAGHPLARKIDVGFDEILNYPLLSSSCSEEVVLNLVAQYGDKAQPMRLLSQTSDDWESILKITCQSDAIHLGSEVIARDWIQDGRLVEIDFNQSFDLSFRMALITSVHHSEESGVSILRGFMIERLTELQKIFR